MTQTCGLTFRKIPTNEEMKKEIKEKQKEINDKKQQGTHEPNKNFHATRKKKKKLSRKL